MEIKKSKLKGVFLIFPKKIKDQRGYFMEIYNLKKITNNNSVKFVQENESLSKYKGTFRGIHFQKYPFCQDKLIRVIKGKVLDFIIDLRKNSKTYLKSEIYLLSAKNNKLLWLPKGFGHAFLTLEDNTIINYKVTKFYSKKHDSGISIFDDRINKKIPFNLKKLIVSKKDKKLPLLDLKKKYFN